MYGGMLHSAGLGESDEADETDDSAEGANIRLGELEWFETWVLRDAENAIIVFFALFYTLDEGTLTGVENIDATPLKEKYVGNFSTCYDVAIIVEWKHGIA